MVSPGVWWIRCAASASSGSFRKNEVDTEETPEYGLRVAPMRNDKFHNGEHLFLENSTAC
jgi:hypothetical protein